ncbi:hypothetical protein MHU86_20839 [Fragilaria crotonensis]|nr:hypothetical protein MHU86_20839 [Fragilaria crotonensis]
MNHLVRRMVSQSSTPPRQWSLLPLASAAVAAASLSLSVETFPAATCEEQHSPPPHYHSEHQQQHPSVPPGLHGKHEDSNENEKDDIDEEEEDEVPQCILCLTFRSGPCRSFFIPYEKCLKANPSPDSSDYNTGDESHVTDKNANHGEPNVTTTPVDDDATSTTNNHNNNNDDDPANACMDEVMPFLECISQYSNMHMLLFLQSYQQLYIDPFETHLKEIQTVTPLPWTGVDMDWSDVWTYANDNNLTLADFSATPSVDWNEFLSSGKYYYQQDDNDSTTGSTTTTTIKDLDDCASDPTCPARDLILGKSVHDEPIYNPQTFTEDIKTLIPVGVRVNLYDDAGTTADDE